MQLLRHDWESVKRLYPEPSELPVGPLHASLAGEPHGCDGDDHLSLRSRGVPLENENGWAGP
jgi:hypothetical protein